MTKFAPESIEKMQQKISELETENAALKQNLLQTNEARDFYLKIFEDFPALIWRAGLNMKCDYFNRTWLAFTGRTQEQENGDGWAEGVHPDDLNNCFKIYVENFQKKLAFRMEYRLKRHDGEYRWILDIGRPFYGLNNEFLGYIGSCFDITEERELRSRTLEMVSARNLMLSIVAHDLRGPLSSLRSLLSMYASTDGTRTISTISSELEMMSTSVSDIISMMENLLTWSRGQLGNFICRPSNEKIDVIINTALAPHQIKIHMKKIQLACSLTENLTAFIDKDMILVVLNNLIGNAVQHCAQGGNIEIKTESAADEVMISIKNSSSEGIQSDDEYLLTSDAQPVISKKDITSQGLGLMLCHDFTRLNKGRIALDFKNSMAEVILHLPSDPVHPAG